MRPSPIYFGGSTKTSGTPSSSSPSWCESGAAPKTPLSSIIRRLRLVGEYRHDREFLVGPRGPPPGALADAPGSSAQGLSSSPQGYYVVTPLQLSLNNNSNKGTSDNDKRPTTTPPPLFVLVNRGWLPRHMVQQPQSQQKQRQQQQRATESPSQPPNSPLPQRQWNRPTGTVQVTVVPAKPEGTVIYGTAQSGVGGLGMRAHLTLFASFSSYTIYAHTHTHYVLEPKFLVAQHNLTTVPAVLYWYDLPTMLSVADIPLATNNTNTDHDEPMLVFATQVQMDDGDDGSAKTTTTTRTWPVPPHASKVGDFKVSPAVHAGYAVTWYGLCAAGLYMTRILLTRGRAS
jgi:surfeit locus 1 family protein